MSDISTPTVAPKVALHRQGWLKLSLICIAIVVTFLALSSFLNSNHIKQVQQEQSQKQVAAHTQTLNEIKGIVTQLEQNNQTNHDTTIAYLECIVQGLTTATPANSQSTLNACIAVSGLPTKNPALPN
jgi:hypothetical protein